MFSAEIYLLLSAAFVIVAGGDYLTKRWTSGHGEVYLATAMACYMVVSCIWFMVIKRQPELGRIGVIWTTSAMVASVLIGLVFFDESMDLTNKFGVLLCILGVVLTSL